MGDHVELSQEELWVLLAQFAPGIVVGFRDPTRGLLAGEVKRLHDGALRRLIERGYVRLVSDQEFAIDEVLARMVYTVAKPKHSVIATFHARGSAQTVHTFHFGAGLVVELAEQAPGIYWLSALENRHEVINRLRVIQDMPEVGVSSPARGDRFELPERALNNARRFASEGRHQDARSVLCDAGLTDRQAEDLMPALTAPVYNLALAVLADRDSGRAQSVRGFGVLAGSKDVWLLRPRGEPPMIEVCAGSVDGLVQLIDEVLPS